MVQKIRRFLSAICFCLVVLLCISSLSQLQWDDYQSNWNGDDDYPYEVLWLGSSHVYFSIIPQLLYDEYGLESFSAASSYQTPLHTYSLLKDMKNLDCTKLVVMDVYSLLRPYTYDTGFNHSLTSTDPSLIPPEDLPMHYNVSAAAIRELSELNPLKYLRLLDEPEMATPLQYYFSVFNAHTQYLQLTRSNYEHTDQRFTRNKNFAFATRPVPLDNPFENEIYPVQMNTQCQQQLMNIIALCKEKNIPLLLTAIPYGISPEARSVME